MFQSIFLDVGKTILSKKLNICEDFKRKIGFMIYSVLDVSRYIINYSNAKEYGISNLKLQKILYLVQAYFLIETGFPCFKEKIEAWDFGPVVPVAYREFKGFASTDIPTVNSYFVFDENDIWNTKCIEFNKDCINDKDKVLINKVVDRFSEYSATDLVKLTQHQTPWMETIASSQNNEITKESILKYFNGL